MKRYLFLLFCHAVHPCAWTPGPLPFAPPSYIDLIFEKIPLVLEDQEIYTKRGLFLRLVNAYPKTALTAPQKNAPPTEEIQELCRSHGVLLDPALWESFSESLKTQPAASEILSKIQLFLQGLLDDKVAPKKIEMLLHLRIQIAEAFCKGNPENLRADLFSKIEELEKDLGNKEVEYYLQYLKIALFFDVADARLPNGAKELLSTLAEELRKDQTSSYAWLKETVLYLTARLDLILSQKNWDGWTSPHDAVINLPLLEKAEEGFKVYRATYPQGLYVNSAENIQRRIDFLAGRKQAISQALSQKMNVFLASPQRDEASFKTLLDEMRRYSPASADFEKDHPLLLAFHVLYNASVSTEENLKALVKNEARFADYPLLYPLLKAIMEYNIKDYPAVLATTKGIEAKNEFLVKSLLALRAHAYAQLGQKEQALDLWQSVFKVSPEDSILIEILNLLYSLHRFKEILEMPVPQNVLNAFVELGIPTEDLLACQDTLSLTAKEVVATELLRRSLLSRNYVQFEKTWDFMQKNKLRLTQNIPYQAIAPSMGRLAQNPQDLKAEMDVAKFIYDHLAEGLLDPDSCAWWLQVMNPQLRPTRPWEKGFLSPYQTFQKVAKAFRSTGQKSPLEAEALHYLTRCFRSGYLRGQCILHAPSTPAYVGKDTSKAFYLRLHKRYPGSEWAKKTPYYYG